MTKKYGERSEHLRDVEVPHPSYQPTAAELREDLRVSATFEEAVKAVTAPARVRCVMPSREE